ncbi:28S ribosomal protein S7, mitochondrial [Pseudomyrmex gracilis]|uniref:28S ribosomal protein S7, mitochondrial n=1 Tax=Pseudomyrmex gracilis TaxID=219809 RepID=UPI0009958ABA|nr:28S ribosomal protein S7, mitochondrial [Pseudomyrmex gracilis]
MINSRLFVASVANLLNNRGLTRRFNLAIVKREYSVFPNYYIQPKFRKDAQDALFQKENEEAKEIAHKQIKPATVIDTCSEFYDARVIKFTNTLMKNGDRKLATALMSKTFNRIKRFQLERYHKAKTAEEKDNVELDPLVVFHRALDNCTPILQLVPCRKGGITYQIPVPITEKLAQHKAILWLISAANEKDRNARFYDALAREMITASMNQGRAVNWKQELHKRCQANRAYAHFRWM